MIKLLCMTELPGIFWFSSLHGAGSWASAGSQIRSDETGEMLRTLCSKGHHQTHETGK